MPWYRPYCQYQHTTYPDCVDWWDVNGEASLIFLGLVFFITIVLPVSISWYHKTKGRF